MASAMYPLSRERLLEWLLTDSTPTGVSFYALGVDASYVYNATHENVSDIPGTAITAPETALASVTYASGYLDADDVLFESLDDTDEIHAVVVYAKWTGGDLLFAFIDSTSDGSLPQPIDGTKGLVKWHDNGIFRI